MRLIGIYPRRVKRSSIIVPGNLYVARLKFREMFIFGTFKWILSEFTDSGARVIFILSSSFFFSFFSFSFFGFLLFLLFLVFFFYGNLREI